MRIYHFCQFNLRHSNGVQAAVWELAKAQANLGEKVHIVSLGRKPLDSEIHECGRAGVVLRGVAGRWPNPRALSSFVRELVDQRGAACHLHSIFIPWHTTLACLLRRRGVPYFISPHGNLAPAELARKPQRKRLYLRGFEIATLASAAGWLCLSNPEKRCVQEIAQCERAAVVIGNCLDPQPFASVRRSPAGASRRAIFLGKSDLVNKAFDRMAQVAEAFEGGVDFYVVPQNQLPLRQEFERFVSQSAGTAPCARFHGPVYGDDKLRALSDANFCLHLARWEVFGMAILEAAMSGLPLVLSSECDISQEAEDAGAAYVMRAYDSQAVAALREWVQNDARTNLAGVRAREWARANYAAPIVAARVLNFYRERLSLS